MLQIHALTYRLGARLLFEDASVNLPEGHKVGLVGRNGVGKSTLLKLLLGELTPESGRVSIPRNARIGTVAQEAPGGDQSLLDVVMAGDLERESLLLEAETAQDPTRIAEIQIRLADIDSHSAPSRAAVILSGLGFDGATQLGPCSALSGGWRMRVALAAALFGKPDVLLLDEPTNYLDLEGTIWLKSYLRNYPATVLLVSHDRDLLNESVDSILHLDQAKLTLYTGNYDNFERQRREKQALSQKLRKKQEEQRDHMQAFVDRFKAKASKARQAQSRMKALAKMQPVAEIIDNQIAPFIFPNPEKAIAPPLVRWDQASVGYGDKPVLKNITLRLDPDDRVALLGSNGNGKSTFAKLLCGQLQLMGGEMSHPSRLTIGYFAQHQLDELAEQRTPYSYMVDLMPKASVSERRARLGSYGFGAHLADSLCSVLSGGEKARLLFMLASFHAPHLLILDEPTNHLDVDSREALIMAINDYEGAVVLISHEPHIIETCVDKLWLVHNGSVAEFDGDMADYTNLVLSRMTEQRKGAKQAKREQGGESLTTPPPVITPTMPPHLLQKKIQELDVKILKLKENMSILELALADPTLYQQQPQKAADYAKLHRKFEKELGVAEHRWLELQESVS